MAQTDLVEVDKIIPAVSGSMAGDHVVLVGGDAEGLAAGQLQWHGIQCQLMMSPLRQWACRRRRDTGESVGEHTIS